MNPGHPFLVKMKIKNVRTLFGESPTGDLTKHITEPYPGCVQMEHYEVSATINVIKELEFKVPSLVIFYEGTTPTAINMYLTSFKHNQITGLYDCHFTSVGEPFNPNEK